MTPSWEQLFRTALAKHFAMGGAVGMDEGGEVPRFGGGAFVDSGSASVSFSRSASSMISTAALRSETDGLPRASSMRLAAVLRAQA